MPTAPVQIVIVKPAGNVHAEAFRELAETLREGFEQLGLEAHIQENRFSEQGPDIVLGWHLLEPDQWEQLAPGSVLYNLEQFDERNRELRILLADHSDRFQIWDYSQRNIEILKNTGFQSPITWVPIGNAPSLTRIEKAPVQDIDVLFYGSTNQRRLQILDELEATGLNVQAVFGVYGTERDALIARAKVVLNLHYYESSIFEMVRVSYLLANRVPVVAECHTQTEVDEGMRNAAVLVPYEHLVSACVELVHSPERRQILADRAYATISNLQESVILARAMSQTTHPWSIPAPTAGVMPLPPVPAVSVVLITQNRRGFLRRALQSVQAQLFRDFEVLVVNDGGEDVADVIEAFVQGGLSITLLNHAERQGQSAARNTALLHARGQWIAYLDDDDLYYPEHLELMVGELRRTGAWVAYSDSLRATEEERNGAWVVQSRELAMSHDFDRDRFLIDNLTPINNVVHARACWEICGPHDESLPVLEDWDYWIRLSRRWDFLHVPKVTAEVRWRASGANITFEQRNLFPECRARIAEKIRLALAAKTPRQAPEALLFEPDWSTAEWVEVLLCFLQAFQPDEPVSLIMPMDPNLPGQIPVAEAEQQVRSIIARTGRETFPTIELVDQPRELLDILQKFTCIQRIPSGKGRVEGLDGAIGTRFAAVRKLFGNDAKRGSK